MSSLCLHLGFFRLVLGFDLGILSLGFFSFDDLRLGSEAATERCKHRLLGCVFGSSFFFVGGGGLFFGGSLFGDGRGGVN